MAKAKKSRRKSHKPTSKPLKVTHIVIPERPSGIAGRVQQVTIGLFILVTTILAGGLVVSISHLSQAPSHQNSDTLEFKYHSLHMEILELEQAQNQAQFQVIEADRMQRQLAQVQTDIDANRRQAASKNLRTLEQQLRTYNNLLATHVAGHSEATSASGPSLTVPILIYHYTPVDFEAQLRELEEKHYQVITLDQLDDALHARAQLPPKPAIITFDDGFSNQMSAFVTLQRHKMPATYYIVNGGERSKWCIGAGRRSGDPLQPEGGCGDAYLTWDQIRELDHSGLATIASHTVDHENLAKLSPAEQTFEIAEGKRGLEDQLGHSVRHFAYPYGGYNETTVAIVRAAGFVTAVSTIPGTEHSLATEFALHRVRDPYHLP